MLTIEEAKIRVCRTPSNILAKCVPVNVYLQNFSKINFFKKPTETLFSGEDK